MATPDQQVLALWRRDWLLAKRQAETTIDTYQRHVDHFRETLDDRSLTEATRLDVEA